MAVMIQPDGTSLKNADVTGHNADVTGRKVDSLLHHSVIEDHLHPLTTAKANRLAHTLLVITR